jgi:hypothetical protein
VWISTACLHSERIKQITEFHIRTGDILLEIEEPVQRNENIGLFLATWVKILDDILYTYQSKRNQVQKEFGNKRISAVHETIYTMKICYGL